MSERSNPAPRQAPSDFQALGDFLHARLTTGRSLSPSPAELRRRRLVLAQALDRRGAGLFVGFDGASIQYLTRYRPALTERPVAVLLTARGEASLFTPLLRAPDAAAQAVEAVIESYREYPGHRHPMEVLAGLIRGKRNGKIVLEAPSYASPHGYRGAPLADLLGGEIEIDGDLVKHLRTVKSAEEIALLRHAADWAMWAHWLLQRETRPGIAASAAAGAATGAAMGELRARFGAVQGPAWPLQVSAGFDGQVGVDGTVNHAHRTLDSLIGEAAPLITRAAAYIGGYYADVERSFVAGEATVAYRDLFAQASDIHRYALGLVRPGMPVGEIDRRVSHKFAEMGIEPYWRHHVGHSLGLLEREEPYLDVGIATALAPGMVVTVEPGVYRPGVGGIRNSDCVLVTESGSENLTPYPVAC